MSYVFILVTRALEVNVKNSAIFVNFFPVKSFYKACRLLHSRYLLDLIFNPEGGGYMAHFHGATRCYITSDRILTMLKYVESTGWTTGGREFESREGQKNVHFSISSRPALGSTQPPIKWVPGVKRPESEADHSPAINAEVKKMWIYTSTPPYVFMA
jgi:hypothetical protein